MSLLGDAAGIVASVSGLAQQFAGVGLDVTGFSGSQPTPEYIAGTVTGVVADAPAAVRMTATMIRNINNRNVGVSTADNAAGLQMDPQHAASRIAWTLSVAESLELLSGFGMPYVAAELEAGSDEFTSLSEHLRSALPADTWYGAASQMYADHASAQQVLARQLATLDVKIADLVAEQAEVITHIRLSFSMLKDLLVAALAIEYALRAANWTLSDFVSVTIAVLGTGAALGMVGLAAACSGLISDSAYQLIGQYSQ